MTKFLKVQNGRRLINLPTGVRRLLMLQRRRKSAKQFSIDSLPQPCFIGSLPLYVLGAILVRLDHELVVRCKVVSKLWNTYISSSLFSDMYSKAAEPNAILLLSHDESPNSYFTGGTIDFFRHQTEPHVYQRQKNFRPHSKPIAIDQAPKTEPRFRIFNSCDGLLCLMGRLNQIESTIVISNPLTGEFLELPQHAHSGKHLPSHVLIHVALGVGGVVNLGDEVFKGYKVVKMSATRKNLKRDPGLFAKSSDTDGNYRSVMIEVYQFGYPSWRVLGGGANIGEGFGRLDWPTCIYGAIHWLTFNRSILRFNLIEETFDTFPTPASIIGDKDNFSMGDFKGSLYICDKSSRWEVNIWVLKDYGNHQSWVRVYSIPTFERIVFWPVSMSEDHFVVLYYSRGDISFFICEHGSNADAGHLFAQRKFRLPGSTPRLIQLVPFVPNILPMKRMWG